MGRKRNRQAPVVLSSFWNDFGIYLEALIARCAPPLCRRLQASLSKLSFLWLNRH